MPENHPSVLRVKAALRAAGHHDNVTALDDAARTAKEAADALGIEVGQVASSIVFGLATEGEPTPLLVVTSGQHKVDTARVAQFLGVEKLLRADADFVRHWSGFAIGGVSPIGWESDATAETTSTGHPQELTMLVDTALNDFSEVWAAAGHPHTVFPTTFAQLVRMTQGTPCDAGVHAASE
jgi:prolyl-tRNA editing enzyme YbaK/EbsC (Cys-tRNA(Pro) deacylase)